MVIVDETGDRKKGNKTDYVERQYIGNLGKIENGIVAVTAYGVIRGMTFPLLSQVYKPKSRMKSLLPQGAGEISFFVAIALSYPQKCDRRTFSKIV